MRWKFLPLTDEMIRENKNNENYRFTFLCRLPPQENHLVGFEKDMFAIVNKSKFIICNKDF